MKILSALILLLLASLPVRADNIEAAGSATWGSGFGFTETFNVSFDYNTVSQSISDVSVSSSGPMGPFSLTSYSPSSIPAMNFQDALGDLVQIGPYYIDNSLSDPFPNVGSELSIVLSGCNVCGSHGLYVGEGGVATVVGTPEPSTFVMLVPMLIAFFVVTSRSRRRTRVAA